MKQLTLATSAADLTLTATSFPDDETCDLTITFHQVAASAASFNIPLLIQDIPDLLSALHDILGPIHAEYTENTCDDEPDAETEPTANGLGEDILREYDNATLNVKAGGSDLPPCAHEFMTYTSSNPKDEGTFCIHCGKPLAADERGYMTAWAKQHTNPID